MADPKTMKLLEEMRLHGESSSTDKDGHEWRSIYLDNVNGGMSVNEFAGRCAALEKMGVYKPIEKFWGDVRMD
jgi:hypothetical protein